MKEKDDELKDRDLRNVIYKNQKLERYDAQKRSTHKKFMS